MTCHRRYSIFTNLKKCCFSDCTVLVFLWSMHRGASWCGSASIGTRGLNNAQRSSLSPKMCRTNGYSFLHVQSVCGNHYQTSIFFKITMWICLRIDTAPTLLLEGVIFGAIGGSLDVSTSPHHLYN